MYIYSDLIESLAVGDIQANILRTIVPRGQPGEMVAEEIKTPTYHRLRTSIFSSVEIKIRSNTGSSLLHEKSTLHVEIITNSTRQQIEYNRIRVCYRGQYCFSSPLSLQNCYLPFDHVYQITQSTTIRMPPA